METSKGVKLAVGSIFLIWLFKLLVFKEPPPESSPSSSFGHTEYQTLLF